MVLRGGRCAAGSKYRNFIKGSSNDRPRIVPTGNLRSGSNSAERRDQRRRVQRLADMASVVRSAIVLVQEAAAAGEIQQRQAQHHCGKSPQALSGQHLVPSLISGTSAYTPTRYLDAATRIFVALFATLPASVLDPTGDITYP